MKSTYTVKSVNWRSPDADAARDIRMQVFVAEQQVPAELELDATDDAAYHVIAVNAEGTPCGTGRLFPDATHSDCAHIGRMAVTITARGTGCGAAILHALIQEARSRGFAKVVLSAQTHAKAFYTRHGFSPYGAEYLVVGIPHQTMELDLTRVSSEA